MQDKCFLWPKNKENWRKTKEYCKKENGHLASITNIGIHNYFLSKLNRKLKDKETWFRVGGTDQEEGGIGCGAMELSGYSTNGDLIEKINQIIR